MATATDKGETDKLRVGFPALPPRIAYCGSGARSAMVEAAVQEHIEMKTLIDRVTPGVAQRKSRRG